jgi:hypothetical protein
MSTFKLKDIANGKWPGQYVACVRMHTATGKTYGEILTIPRAQFAAHNRRASALEQEEADRKRIADILKAAEDAIKDLQEQKRLRRERARIAAAEAKLEARREAKRRAGNRLYNAVLKQLQTQWRAPTVGQASVQAAPVAAPAPIVPKLEEIATLADLERLARVAVEQTRPRYEAIMYADNSICETTRGISMDRKNKLTF